MIMSLAVARDIISVLLGAYDGIHTIQRGASRRRNRNKTRRAEPYEAGEEQQRQ